MDFTEEELAELYDRYAHVIFHRCRSILKNDEDANDAVQETFARVIRNAESFRRQSSPLTWMYKISTNYCLNQLRNRKGRADKLHDRKAELVPPPPDEESSADHARVIALLEEVDEQTRRVVIHTYFDDCTRAEIAKLVGISVPTVRKRLRTFLDKARRSLGVASAVAVLLVHWSLP